MSRIWNLFISSRTLWRVSPCDFLARNVYKVRVFSIEHRGVASMDPESIADSAALAKTVRSARDFQSF